MDDNERIKILDREFAPDGREMLTVDMLLRLV
jgi:hypothetical protein